MEINLLRNRLRVVDVLICVAYNLIDLIFITKMNVCGNFLFLGVGLLLMHG